MCIRRNWLQLGPYFVPSLHVLQIAIYDKLTWHIADADLIVAHCM